MLFNSIVFLIFAAVFFSAWPFVKKNNNLRSLFIVACSFLFYGWWDWRFVFLIIASGLIDYFSALGIASSQRHRTKFLWISICANIGSLAIFKYFNFFLDNANHVATALGSTTTIPSVNLILPVGISFYTFQSMSYTIDVYRGNLRPTKNIAQFFAYLSMFPQLVAGPIVRARDIIPALAKETKISSDDQWVGFRWIVHGYFKKMVIADNLAPIVDAAFSSDATGQSCAFWWVIIVMFSLQIYCDFSGYSDIARGLGKWMGFDFPLNFNHPYISIGFRDFWERWHISLSSWFRDYVYIPLGGSKARPIRIHINLWITMVVSGLWHGPAWTFIIWGAIHAALMSVERWTHWPAKISNLPIVGRVLGALLTYLVVCLTWVFFRAESMDQASRVISKMSHLSDFHLSEVWSACGMLPAILIAGMFLRESFFLFRLDQHKFFKTDTYANIQTLMLSLVILGTILFRGPGQTFVYFQF